MSIMTMTNQATNIRDNPVLYFISFIKKEHKYLHLVL